MLSSGLHCGLLLCSYNSCCLEGNLPACLQCSMHGSLCLFLFLCFSRFPFLFFSFSCSSSSINLFWLIVITFLFSQHFQLCQFLFCFTSSLFFCFPWLSGLGLSLSLCCLLGLWLGCYGMLLLGLLEAWSNLSDFAVVGCCCCVPFCLIVSMSWLAASG